MRFLALFAIVTTVATLSFARDRAPTVESDASAMGQDAGAKSKCKAGWIDACGDCFQPCNADADCKVKGQSCQPIVCAHTPYGNGCTSQ